MKTIGRYKIRGLLGRGGMGRIYKVELPVIGRIAALKLLDPDPLVEALIGKENIRAIFEKEAATMAAIHHPNIVSINDYDHAQDKWFYVMDFFVNSVGTMMGETYVVEAQSRPIPADKAVDYARQTLEGIRCLHDAGIIHRDIKPFNLLVTPQDILKICDFGLSKLRGETYAGPSHLKVGSPYYAAPEQEINPDHVDERADLYPVGIMLYRMLSGHLATLQRDGSGYRPLSTYNPDLDDRWDDFVRKAIANNPDDRFSSAKEMLARLNLLEQQWIDKIGTSCRMLPEADPIHRTSTIVKLRRQPVKCPPADAAEQFNLDALWRPLVYHSNDCSPSQNEATIHDKATGLVWQQSGSDYPRPWTEADEYIRQLNERNYGGYSEWRLPTINELTTLLSPVPQGRDLCIAPVFDATQRWLWSADRRSYIAGYYVDAELGFVGWQDFSAPFYVRAVC